MTEVNRERHVLVIDDHECGVFSLEAATYSIGRDASNAIALNDKSISRQHALLLRMPIPKTDRYKYHIMDGDSKGQSSTNGTLVNGQPCRSRELSNGDIIQFGQSVCASYLIFDGEESEFHNYIQSTSFRSIKSQLIDSKATVLAGFPEEDSMGIEFVAGASSREYCTDNVSSEQNDSDELHTILISKKDRSNHVMRWFEKFLGSLS